MSKIKELLLQGRHEDLWQICCGFLDLTIDQFMAIQQNLLLEQIELLVHSQMGRKLMRGALPRTVKEFRQQVPFTTYNDYCPNLENKIEDGLPAKPLHWMQSTGRSGEYTCKWVPVTEKFWEEAGLNFAAIAMLGACRKRGEIAFEHGYKLLHAAGLPPVLTGNVARKLRQDCGFEYFPALDKCEKLPFEERVQMGFNMALSEGIDGFFGLGGVLVGLGEKFKRGSGKLRISKLITRPKVALRLARGLYRCKKAGRSQILPKDIWDLKVIVSMGTDTLIYKDKIRELWGRSPLNVFGNTESTLIATQTWDYGDMTFFPNLNFLEFIPETEYIKWQNDHNYQPKTVLLNEVKKGGIYELVITNLHGGALVRYRIGELIRITSLRNEKLNIDIPQMTFERRADDLIDLHFVRLTERVIWQALENAGIPYRGWMAKKEMGTHPKLHLYIELPNDYINSSRNIADAVYEEIKKMDNGFYYYEDLTNLEELIDYHPIEVTVLHEGVFSSYKQRMSKIGADISELRPPHINPSDDILAQLEADGKEAKPGIAALSKSN